MQMPGRQESGSGLTAASATPAAQPSTAVVIPRLVALALLAVAVAAIAALAGYAGGRASIDKDALQAKGYAAGQIAGERAAQEKAARTAAAAALSSRPASIGPRSRVITGPSAEMRAQLRRAYAAGAASAAAKARSARGGASARAAGAAAALGNFSGWSSGWYIVRVGGGGTASGGQPAIASRLGPLADNQAYMACRGGSAICPVAGR